MTNFQDAEITEGWESIFGRDEYRQALREIADTYPEKKSLFVKYDDMDMYNSDFATFVLEEPDRCIKLAEEVAKEAMPPTWDPVNKINIRLIRLPRDAKVGIRNLRARHLNKMVALEGLVKKVTPVKPRMTLALFTCARCGAPIWQPQDGMLLQEPLMCPNPNGNCNKTANRFILDEEQSIYTDTQKVEIQESPEGLKGGAQPQRLSGYIDDDVAGIITPGNRVTINGIIRSAEKTERVKTTVFEVFVDVVSIEFEQHEYDEIQITEEDEKAIIEMSKDPDLFDNIIASISPTIKGMNEEKAAIALQLFGGTRKVMDDGSVIRGDIHILLIGDPGVAKSQILRYMSSMAPRGIYASGKSASGAGLTAAAVRDEFTGEWALEAGALVLADKGLACIDELDKMSTEDRSSLHEAMESQRISVAKAGITASLQCRCSMLAAANPKLGRFDLENSTIVSQIDLPPALMSRFDLIFVRTDKPDEKRDRDITEHILKVHRRGEALQVDETVELDGVDLKMIKENTQSIMPRYDVETLRKYVAYSKRIIPVMKQDAVDMIQNDYMSIRKSGDDTGSVPITARQLEAYVRLSEASARMRLSPVVEAQDAKRAIDLIRYYLKKIAGTESGGFDIDSITSGISSKDRKGIPTIEAIIRLEPGGMEEEEIVTQAAANGISETEVRRLLQRMKGSGTIYQVPDGNNKVIYRLTNKG